MLCCAASSFSDYVESFLVDDFCACVDCVENPQKGETHGDVAFGKGKNKITN